MNIVPYAVPYCAHTKWINHGRKLENSILGSGLIDQIQKMTVAAMQMADMKVWAQRW